MLQAYALTRTLSRMGYRPEVIDYRPAIQARMYDVFDRTWSLRSVAKNVRSLLFYRMLSSRSRGFERFVTERLPLSRIQYQAAEEMGDPGERYWAVICGSDQIWNVAAPDFTDVYLLPFPHTFKKIAYAPSLNRGAFEASPSAETYRRWLLDFDAISVREASGKEKIERLLNGTREIEVVADPTLLLEASDYDSISSPSLSEMPYVFLYTINFDPSVIQACEILASRTGLRVLTLFTSNRAYGVLAGHPFIRFSRYSRPEDFVSLMRNAAYVVTNSYHGTIFSTLFKRRFYSVIKRAGTGEATADARIAPLLERLGLSQQMILSEDMDRVSLAEELEYEGAHRRLREYASDSVGYLAKHLDDGQLRNEDCQTSRAVACPGQEPRMT